MSKLFLLKRWLTVPQAAAHLSESFGESVSEADVLGLCLDQKLKLSVVFIGDAIARVFELVEDEASIEYMEVPSLLNEGRTVPIPVGGQVIYAPTGHMYQVSKKIVSLESDEPYDLVMMGGERCDIQEQYWTLIGSQWVERSSLDGTFVTDGKRIFQLVDSLPKRNKEDEIAYYPLGTLPDNVAIVVRTSSLLEVGSNMATKGSEREPLSKNQLMEKPLATKERNSLLNIIAALCDYSAVLHQDRGASQKIAAMAKEMTPPVSIDPETVRKYLRLIPDALKDS